MEASTLCPRCQKRNFAEAARCQYCGAMMARAAAGSAPEMTPFLTGSSSAHAPTSGLAIASLILGMLGLFSVGLTALVGLILGIVGLRQIWRSQGRVQGQGVAVAGIVVSGLVLAVMFLFVPIIAAVLYPVFAQAREKARTTVCMTHLRQIGVAMMMYEQDYDEHLPRRQDWCDGVLPYLRTPQAVPAAAAFQCPSLPNQPGAQAYNGLLSTVSSGRIAIPYETAAVFDSSGGWNRAGGAAAAVPRHSGGLNMLFAAGNVRWLRSLETVVWKPGPPAAPAGHGRLHRRRGRSRRG